MIKGKHIETPQERRVRELNDALHTITRIRNEIDPHYIPPYPTKPQGKLSLWFDRINLMIDTVMFYAIWGLIAIIGGFFVWVFVSALLERVL